MTNHKGKGWKNESKRHSDAAKRGAMKAKKATAKDRAKAKKAAAGAARGAVKEAKRRDWAVQAKGVRVESTNPGSQDSAVKKLQRAEKRQQNTGM